MDDELTPGGYLRESIGESTLVVPGVSCGLMARMAEGLGYDAMYLSGAVLSAGLMGIPDVGLFSSTELVQEAARLVKASSLPLIVDADTGFGGPMNVERVVSELEMVGVGGIQLEDQQLPKRCGHLSGKTLVPPEEMCAKLRAAALAKYDDDLVIIGRTDARGVEGLEAAIERAQRYVEAGADWIFPEALQTSDEFERFADAIEAPLIANMTEFGKSPLLPVDELAEMGYAAVLYPVTIFRVAMRAAESALAMLASRGHQRDLLDLMLTREELYELIDYEDFEERDRHFFQGDPQ